MEEKTYPIYSFNASWDQEGFENNGTGFYIMYKEKQSEEQLNIELENWKMKLENSQLEKGKPITKWHKVGYKFVEDETWCLQWFYHMTFNQFENDCEAEESFKKFVKRKECENESNGHHASFDGHTEHNPNSSLPYHCLMGAEDRWRWEVCHCDGCKKNGWTAINH